MSTKLHQIEDDLCVITITDKETTEKVKKLFFQNNILNFDEIMTKYLEGDLHYHDYLFDTDPKRLVPTIKPYFLFASYFSMKNHILFPDTENKKTAKENLLLALCHHYIFNCKIYEKGYNLIKDYESSTANYYKAIYHNFGEPNDAHKAFEYLQNCDQDLLLIKYTKALFLKKIQKHEECEELFMFALEKEYRIDNCLSALIPILKKQERWKDAADLLIKYTPEDKENIASYLHESLQYELAYKYYKELYNLSCSGANLNISKNEILKKLVELSFDVRDGHAFEWLEKIK